MKALLVSLALGVFLANPNPEFPDFTGSWKLDLKESTNLPGSFKQVESYTMDIRQTRDSVIVVIGLKGSGQDVKFPVTNYLLDSSEVFREDTLRHSKRWTRSAWASTGKQMIVTSKVQQGLGEKKMENDERDEWQIKDKNTFQISVSQKFVRGDSTRIEQRIFHRQK